MRWLRQMRHIQMWLEESLNLGNPGPFTSSFISWRNLRPLVDDCGELLDCNESLRPVQQNEHVEKPVWKSQSPGWRQHLCVSPRLFQSDEARVDVVPNASSLCHFHPECKVAPRESMPSSAKLGCFVSWLTSKWGTTTFLSEYRPMRSIMFAKDRILIPCSMDTPHLAILWATPKILSKQSSLTFVHVPSQCRGSACFVSVVFEDYVQKSFVWNKQHPL